MKFFRASTALNLALVMSTPSRIPTISKSKSGQFRMDATDFLDAPKNELFFGSFFLETLSRTQSIFAGVDKNIDFTGKERDLELITQTSTDCNLSGLNDFDLLEVKIYSDLTALNACNDNEYLTGISGNDYLTGAFGNDTFLFEGASILEYATKPQIQVQLGVSQNPISKINWNPKLENKKWGVNLHCAKLVNFLIRNQLARIQSEIQRLIEFSLLTKMRNTKRELMILTS